MHASGPFIICFYYHTYFPHKPRAIQTVSAFQFNGGLLSVVQQTSQIHGDGIGGFNKVGYPPGRYY